MTGNLRPLLTRRSMRRRRRPSAPLNSIRLLPGSFEANAIDALDRMMLFSRVMFTTEAGHLILRIYFRALIGAGTISTTQVIAAARDGNRDADRALREVAAEMLDRGVLPPTLLRDYARDALLQPQATCKQGQNSATHGRGILSSPAWWGRPLEAGIYRPPEAVTARTPVSYRPATSLRRRWDGTASTSASGGSRRYSAPR